MRGGTNMLSKTLRSPLGLSALIICLTGSVTYAFFVRPQPSSESPAAWRKIETNKFSFSIPPDMKERPARGTDSSVWMYSNEKMTLNLEYGLYPDPLKFYADQPDYQKLTIVIDGLRAEQATFRLGESLASYSNGLGKYVAAVHFPDLPNESGTQLTAWVNCDSPAEQQVAKKIFTSMKFNRTRK